MASALLGKGISIPEQIYTHYWTKKKNQNICPVAGQSVRSPSYTKDNIKIDTICSKMKCVPAVNCNDSGKSINQQKLMKEQS